MRSYVATAIVLAMVCPAHAGGDESTWGPAKKAIVHHKPVIVAPALVTVVPGVVAPVFVPPVGVTPITLEELPKLCHDKEIFAANPNWYYRTCYIPPFADSSENPNRDSSSPN